MNLIALKLLFPGLSMDAIEINPEAVKKLRADIDKEKEQAKKENK